MIDHKIARERCQKFIKKLSTNEKRTISFTKSMFENSQILSKDIPIFLIEEFCFSNNSIFINKKFFFIEL